MKRIGVTDLKPGMKLAQPVVNKDGMVLLGQDTELNLSLIDRIAATGIPSVHIQGTAKASMSKDAVLAAIDERFKNVEGMPYMATLKKLMREHTEGLYEEHGPGSHQE
jgi:hypothetical protein